MARPRQFNPEDALQKVKVAFWRTGFEGTSIRDIETETGLRKQSLYRLFGDKRAMYRLSIVDYGRKEVLRIEAFLKGSGPASARFRSLFDALIEEADTELGRRGCFLCNASIDQAQSDEQTRNTISSILRSILKLFEAALADSEPYRSDKSARKLKAASLLTAYNGMSVLIKAGFSKDILRNAADSALQTI